ncbi:hypothetical protein ACKAV7_010487 [Fusarium commune]|nr:hypothetical protein LZL87_007283 [Fusarium oxysporum]
MSSSEIELTAGESKELIEMNIKALYAFDKVRLFLAKRIEESSGRVLCGAGVATCPSPMQAEILLRSSGRRFTVESALEDILEQTMAKLSEEMLFPEWCVKELNGAYYRTTKTQSTDNELTLHFFCSQQMVITCDGLVA